MINDKKIALIIGISGQDGSYLAHFLLKKDYNVYGSSRDHKSHKFENLKILKIAKFVKNKINCKIELKKNFNDPRSYRQNSDKLILTGFKPMFSVQDAIEEVKSAYISKRLKNSKKFFTVSWMKKLKIS